MNIFRNIVSWISNRKRTRVQNEAYTELNNLYLDVEAGRVVLTKPVGRKLMELAVRTEGQAGELLDWWLDEFRRLPNWLNV